MTDTAQATPAQTQIVIIGASLAGSFLKESLLKQSGITSTSFITVIEKQEAYSWVLGGTRSFIDLDYGKKYHISYEKYFADPSRGKVIHGTVSKVGAKTVLLKDGREIAFDYLVVTSGTRYLSTTPFKLQKETKAESVATLVKSAEIIKGAKSIVCVGGGPTGIEGAAIIKEKYPDKDVTLIHSGQFLLNNYTLRPSFPKHVHDLLVSLGVKVVLNERVIVSELVSFEHSAPHEVKTESGKTFPSDVTLNCIGFSSPNTEFLEDQFLDEEKYVKVNSFLQSPSNPRIFAMGDVAAGIAPPRYSPIKEQAVIVTSNILASIQGVDMKEYKYKPSQDLFLAFGSKKAAGQLPIWMPQFLMDGLAKTFKSADLYGSHHAKTLYNQSIK